MGALTPGGLYKKAQLPYGTVLQERVSLHINLQEMVQEEDFTTLLPVSHLLPIISTSPWSHALHGLIAPMVSYPPWSHTPHSLTILLSQPHHGLITPMVSTSPWSHPPGDLNPAMVSSTPWSQPCHSLIIPMVSTSL